MRIERDSIGEVQLPDDVYWGIHTDRSKHNFISSGENIHPVLIKSMLQVKEAAALTNERAGVLEKQKSQWIVSAVHELIAEAEAAYHQKNHSIYEKIICEPYQGGAGTSLNMNVNEVIANTALEMNGIKKGDYRYLHPLDDVNMSQSTNDVFPTAVKLAAIYLLRELSNAFAAIQGAFQKKEKEFSAILKVGRTQMMDAVPVILGQEFGAYAQAMSRDRWRLYKVEERLRLVNLGGTAIGTGVAAPRKYILQVVNTLREMTGVGLAKGEDLIDQTQNLDVFVEVHGLIKAGAASLLKIANDLRLMNSGPRAGIGEITLPEVQHGSSIMPGKINPVIPEHVIQVCQLIMGHDGMITQLCAAGSQELNAFFPMIAHQFLKSFSLLKDVIHIFIEKAINGIIANEDRCQELLYNSYSIGTFLINHLGYDQATALIKEAADKQQNLIDLVAEKKILSPDEFKSHISAQLGIYKNK